MFEGAFVSDGLTRFLKILVLVAAALTLLMTFDTSAAPRSCCSNIPVLMLLATLGMLMMVSANDLIALYLGLELQSLALYVVAAFKRDDVKSSEAGLKYFVLGALSSGMLLYGASMLYGVTGSTGYAAIAAAAGADGMAQNIGLIVGLVFVLVGLAFKISAVPFHMWTPDVYQGAPTPVTAFFAGAPKVAAMALLIRFTQVALPTIAPAVAADRHLPVDRVDGARRVRGHRTDQHQAAAGLFVDRPRRLRARRPRRQQPRGYGRRSDLPRDLRGYDARRLRMRSRHAPQGQQRRGDVGSRWPRQDRPRVSRPYWRSLMFSLAGIPPLAGFWAKWYVFLPAIKAGLYPLAVIGVIASVIGAFYYLRIVKIMFFDDAAAAVRAGREQGPSP